jgi:predicted nucleic acid-binding protein
LSFISLDTGPIVEYVNVAGAFHSQAKAIFDNIISGKILGLITHPVLAEAYYVSYRVYEKLRLEDPESRAHKLAEWLYMSPNIELADQTLELALTAGKIKKQYSLTLTDAYVIAASKIYNGKAVFRTRDSEIHRKMPELSKNYDLVFLEDYATKTEDSTGTT